MISNRNLQNVIIKGTKDGLTLHLNDSCSFQSVIEELNEKLSISYRLVKEDDPLIPVKVHTGNRQFSQEEQEQIVSTIESNSKLLVDRIQSGVMAIEEATRLIEEGQIKSMVGKVRSGQVIEAPGDLLLIGDINPGAQVKAVGNIFIIGTIKGYVHAGYKGNTDAIIAASQMEKALIGIADLHTAMVTSGPKDRLKQYCAYINDENNIVFDKIQVLRQLRPNLTRLEGGI